MKRSDKSSIEAKNFELFISKLTGNEVLNTQALASVRGGDGEASGGEVGIIIPPKPAN